MHGKQTQGRNEGKWDSHYLFGSRRAAGLLYVQYAVQSSAVQCSAVH